jgi:uncharacterized protein (DUF924 family)
MQDMDEARQVREFWFGRLPVSAAELQQRMKLWFGDDESPTLRRERDESIRTRFTDLMERAARGELDAWADSPRRRLSLIIVLDQFPRNIYRGSPDAFAHDSRALELSLSGMQSGADGTLDPVERIFFYMPLQHAESLEVQDESVAAFRRLRGEAPEELRSVFDDTLRYAELHRTLIQRFGRFPHRNGIVGRTSTPEELSYLAAEDAETFGQLADEGIAP